MEYIAFDAHKRYTLASVARADGHLVHEARIEHERGALREFLARCEPESPVAVEATGNWYWIVDEIEAGGCIPKLVHARKAKLMLGMINKTDKLDARGLNRLQRAGTLPTVWIPPGELRDRRDLTRTRIVFLRQRTQLKNRDVQRFATSEKLAAYAGTTPRVHSSGGKTRYGPLRSDVNRYLKWAFVEAANVVCRHRRRHPHRHVSRLYERIARRKGHQKAIGAVARHLAEATYWILARGESYREPTRG